MTLHPASQTVWARGGHKRYDDTAQGPAVVHVAFRNTGATDRHYAPGMEKPDILAFIAPSTTATKPSSSCELFPMGLGFRFPRRRTETWKSSCPSETAKKLADVLREVTD